MSEIDPKQMRVLAIAPSTRGFGFAVLEGSETLVDWGVKSVAGDKNTCSLSKVEELISHYQPEFVALENDATKQSARSPRIRALSRRIIAMVRKSGLDVALLPRQEIRKVFFGNCQGTKHALAEILATRFPQELGFRLPPKRRPWMSEDYRMDIFDAVALALVWRLRNTRKTPEPASESP